MSTIQNICEKISNKVGEGLSLEETQRAVINYGVFAIIQTSLSIILTLVFGMLFGVLSTAFIISLSAIFLRKYSGGAHAKTPECCALVGLVISVGGASIVSKISWNLKSNIIIGSTVFIVAFYLVHKLAPIDSKAKPIKKEEKRQKLRKKSIFILYLFLGISIMSLYLYLTNSNANILIYLASLYVGIGWQVFTLTTVGHKVMGEIDLLFNKLIQNKGGN